MFGAAAGAGLGFARDWTDDRIYTRRKLAAICDLPILAEVPAFPDDAANTMATLLDAPKSPFASGIQRLRYLLRTAGPTGSRANGTTGSRFTHSACTPPRSNAALGKM